jgi:hypothetical protein
VLAGAEFQRGLWQLWEAVYQATLSLWPPMLLGVAVYPWVRWLQRREPPAPAALALHALAALLFGASWQAGEFSTAWLLYGVEHARGGVGQTLLWRAIWGLLVYAGGGHRVHRDAADTPRPRGGAVGRRRPSPRWRAPSSPRSPASSIRTSSSTR